MLILPLNSMDLPYATGLSAAAPAKPSEIEITIIQLFEEFHHPLHRYAVSFGLSTQDGEEIVQEVFLALFQHLRRGKCRKNLRGWVFRVAHNLALKQAIANRKAQVRLDPDETMAERQPDCALNPEEQAATSQRSRRMQAVLRALPQQDRCCLSLRAEGLRYREIAATLGMSLGAVSIALARSLDRMSRVQKG